MAQCPHSCSRCAALEAGYGGRGLTPSEFLKLFADDLVEQPHRNGTPAELAEAIAEAEVARDAAEEIFQRAHDEVGRLIVELKGKTDAAALEDALVIATEERVEAGEELVKARVAYHELARRDDERRIREAYEANQAVMAQERAKHQQERKDRGGGVLRALRGGRK